jgi:hypothetical protein
MPPNSIFEENVVLWDRGKAVEENTFLHVLYFILFLSRCERGVFSLVISNDLDHHCCKGVWNCSRRNLFNQVLIFPF